MPTVYYCFYQNTNFAHMSPIHVNLIQVWVHHTTVTVVPSFQLRRRNSQRA